jgi:hypothetical protein
MRFWIALSLAILATMVGGTVSAEEEEDAASANYIMVGCRAIEDMSRTDSTQIQKGVCLGIMIALMNVSDTQASGSCEALLSASASTRRTDASSGYDLYRRTACPLA